MTLPISSTLYIRAEDASGTNRNPGAHPIAAVRLFHDSEGVYACGTVCSAKDKFNKRIANKILNDRMNSLRVIPVNGNVCLGNVLYDLGLTNITTVAKQKAMKLLSTNGEAFTNNLKKHLDAVEEMNQSTVAAKA